MYTSPHRPTGRLEGSIPKVAVPLVTSETSEVFSFRGRLASESLSHGEYESGLRIGHLSDGNVFILIHDGSVENSGHDLHFPSESVMIAFSRREIARRRKFGL